MDYTKHYKKLMHRSKVRSIVGYVERHHIIPKCLGGDNSSENIVKLTAREHFIAHLLLCKMYPNEGKLKNALWRFVHGNKHQKIVSSRMYAIIKKQCVEVWRETSRAWMKNKKYKARCLVNFNTKETRKKAAIARNKTFLTAEFKVRKIESTKKAWKDKRGLIPILVFKAIQIQKANKGRPAIWEKGELVAEFPYAKIASQHLKVCATKIASVIQGKRHQSNGYIFERKTE